MYIQTIINTRSGDIASLCALNSGAVTSNLTVKKSFLQLGPSLLIEIMTEVSRPKVVAYAYKDYVIFNHPKTGAKQHKAICSHY